MEPLGCIYPKTSFKQNVNGISGTVNQYTDPNSKMIANMTSLFATRGSTVGCLNRPSAVDRFLDSSCQSRFSHVRWPNIFNYTRGLLGHQMRPLLICTTR